jgi:hypothetical protein
MVTFPPGMYLWRPLDKRPVVPQSSSGRDDKRLNTSKVFPFPRCKAYKVSRGIDPILLHLDTK